jgi:azurin
MKPVLVNLAFAAALVAASLLHTACGGSAAPAAPADGRIIAITANDQMRFSENRVLAAAGERLQVELRNVGRMPKQTMAHNWVLFGQIAEADLNSLLADAVQRRPDYLPQDTSRILARTRLLGPGESDSVRFNAPSAPGEYTFVCTFPGHAAVMRGVLVVQ